MLSLVNRKLDVQFSSINLIHLGKLQKKVRNTLLILVSKTYILLNAV